MKLNKKAMIASSLVTLLPIPVGLLLWDRFPERVTTHWGFDGQPDGWSSVAFAVLLMPLLLLALQWLGIWFTLRDPGNQNRNRKPLHLMLWIVPVTSCLSSFVTYGVALGVAFPIERVMFLALGLMFAAIGNYMPKMKMNATMGIRIPWTYSSEANWNATHRLGGKLWMGGGILIALSALIPGELGIWVMLIAMAVLSVIPMVYSWRFYKKEKAEGKVLLAMVPDMSTKQGKLSAVFLVVLLAFVAVLMFTGDVDVTFGETSFTVDSTFYSPLTVEYAVIENVEYREGDVSGEKTSGFGSARLLLGYFKNEEFGTYTRFTYTNPESCIVVYTDSRTLVLSGRTAQETQAICQELSQKLPR